jgi:hypothetical protein
MIPVDQTELGPKRGDCFAATIASLLHLRAEDVPNFYADAETTLEAWERFCQWCQRRGYSVFEVRTWTEESWTPAPGQLCFVSGPSPRHKSVHHTVVGRWLGKEYTVVHDPHPSRAGLPKITEAGFLIPLDPARAWPDQHDRRALGMSLRKQRKAAGLTLGAMARFMEVGPARVSAIELGRGEPIEAREYRKFQEGLAAAPDEPCNDLDCRHPGWGECPGRSICPDAKGKKRKGG